MVEEPDAVKEVEVGQLAAWTTGYSEEQGSVALILRTTDGREFGVMMPPEDAMTMGGQLSSLGLQLTPAASA